MKFFLFSRPRLAALLVTVIVALSVGVGVGAGASAIHIFYPRQGDRVMMDDLDLTCFESHAAPETNPPFPQTLACGETASGNGP
jgi:hypothetical protein